MNDLESIAQAVVSYIYRNYREKGNRYLLNNLYLCQLIVYAGFDELFQEGGNKSLLAQPHRAIAIFSTKYSTLIH